MSDPFPPSALSNLDDDGCDDARVSERYLASVAERYVLPAQDLVLLHRPEVRDAGTYCEYDRAVYPCRMSIWGRRVLTAAGWNDEDVASLLARPPRHLESSGSPS